MNTRKTVLVTGATGLVGRPLCRALVAGGHRVRTVSRGAGGDVHWDPGAGVLDASALEGVDAVIHLAGESVAQRWTEATKRRILESRERGTALLAERVLASEQRPVFITASGINFYGFDRSGTVDETAGSGDGFLADVCRRWEGAAQPMEEAGCRCVYVRTGVVLSAEGGALTKMLPAFRAGAGGRIGNGRQAMSWIALEDLVRIYQRCLLDGQLSGAVNAVAPKPVSNAVFADTLGKVLGRPTFLPTPAVVVRSLFGEMARETVLSNLSVVPRRLERSAFDWAFPRLEDALKNSLES